MRLLMSEAGDCVDDCIIVASKLLPEFLKLTWLDDRYGFPYKKIPGHVQAAYEYCNGTLAVPPNYPTPAEAAALTSLKSWGDHSLNMFSNPANGKTIFGDCMDGVFTAWENTETQEAESRFAYGALGGLGFLAVVAGLLLGVYLVSSYAKNKSKGYDSLPASTSSNSSIFASLCDKTGEAVGGLVSLLDCRGASNKESTFDKGTYHSL